MGVLWGCFGFLGGTGAPASPSPSTAHAQALAQPVSVSESLTELPARVRPKPVFFPPSHKSDYTVSAIKIVQFCM